MVVVGGYLRVFCTKRPAIVMVGATAMVVVGAALFLHQKTSGGGGGGLLEGVLHQKTSQVYYAVAEKIEQ
jgi:hypothetical protein